MIYIRNRIVLAISEQIMIQRQMFHKNKNRLIPINKPTGIGIIVSWLEIIKSCFVIVVIPTVTEGVDVMYAVACGVGKVGGTLAPSIVRITHKSSPVRIGYCDNVTLQVLDEEVSKLIESYTADVVLVVIEGDKRIWTPFFSEDLSTFKCINVLDTVYCLTCTDAVIVYIIILL